MRITELFTAQSIALDVAAPDQAAIIDKLVDLQATHGNITDKDAYKKALYAREAEASTYVDNGITVPHARTACVTRPSLAALRLSEPVQYNADDVGKTDLLFAIAAPENGSLHIDMLARMMQMLMNEDFVEKLRAAKTPAAFLDAIDAQEDAQFGEESFTEQEIPQNGYRVLAVTACPTGIAHTYLAAEALQQAAQARGLTLKVETNGAAGVNDELTDDEIQAAECVIVAVDRSIPLARFVGKRLVYASAGDAVRDADRLLEKAVSGKAPVYRGGHAFRTSDWKELGREYYGHLMSGISHMLPFVVAGGVMLALSLLLQHLFGRSDITTMMTNVGNAAFRMMYPVLAAFIAYSIADRPGFMPGLMGGYLAQLGTTTAPRLGWISSGFWGAIVAGFAAGLAVRLLNYLFRRIPQELDHIKTGLLVPLLSLLFVGALMVMAINPPLGRFNAWLSIQLDGMQGGSRLVLGTLLGGMMATDYGGPINKAAYVSGTLALVDQQYDLMAAVMAGGMIPPLGIGLACLLFPTRFTSTERCSAPQTLLMGATFVTEGALPFALRDPLRVSLACIAGSALAGFITILLGCGCPAPHGGLFLLPVMENPPGFLIALAVGTLTTALLLGMLKKPLKH